MNDFSCIFHIRRKIKKNFACTSYDELWKIECSKNVYAKDRVQDIKINQLKLEVNDTYRKDEKRPTKFEPSHNENVVNKAYLDTEIFKVKGHISYKEKILMNVNFVTTNSLRRF